MSDIENTASVQTYATGWYTDPHNPNQQRWYDTRGGWSVHTRPDPSAVLTTVNQSVNVAPSKRVNHVLHLLLTIFTGGLWLPVWIILAFAKS